MKDDDLYRNQPPKTKTLHELGRVSGLRRNGYFGPIDRWKIAYLTSARDSHGFGAREFWQYADTRMAIEHGLTFMTLKAGGDVEMIGVLLNLICDELRWWSHE